MSLGKSSATANARPYSAHVEATSSRDDLFEMCAEGDIDGLKAMVLRGANVHEVDRDGNLLTHTAAKNDRLEILKWLVREKHVNINAPNRDNKSPLQLSIEFNRDNIVEWLINKRTETGLMVTNDDLFYAINSERMFMVTTVAKVIGDYYQRNAAGQTPLQFARIVNKPKIEKFLRKKTLMSILMENKSEEEKLKLLQEHLGSQNAGSYEKIDVNKIDRRNENIVIYEAQQKCMKIVKWLVENGADPNSKSRSGSSLLAEISWVENPNNFKWLVDNGASISSKDASGNFAIEKYLHEGNLEMIRWAVQDKGFDPVTHNGNGLNLLSLSIKLGKADIFEFLLQKTSTDVNEQLPKNGTYLHMAVLHGQEEIVKKLLENKAKIDLKDEDGQTPFDLLTKDQTKITELLMISHISNTIKSGDFDEESKIQQLTNFLTKYRKKFETSKDDTNNLSKSVIAIAEKLNLQKLVKWLQRNAVLFEGGKLKEYNVLLVGETGVGKSTFINAFVNYISFNSLDEAVSSKELYCLIPSQFDITDDNYNRHVITFGSDENESFVTGQSSTQSTRSYSIIAGQCMLKFIDTPGIGDTRGIEKDRENFDKLLKVIAELENIHAICVMLKPNNSRLTVLFEYCIKELFSHLNKSASNNILFLFTNSRGTFYRPGDTLPPLLQVLKELKSPPSSVTIPFNKNNVFCMDNESFRFLLARKRNVIFTEEEEKDFRASWNKSASVCRDFVKYLVKLEPHKIQNSVSINAARRLILSLSKPLAEVAQNVGKIALNIQDKKMAIDRNKENMDELKKNLNLKVPSMKIISLPHPFTGCLNRNCVSRRKVAGSYHDVPRECHFPCHERRHIISNIRGHPTVANCSRIKMRCEICRHTYRDHIHLYHRTVIEEITLKNTALQLELKDTNLNQQKIQEILQALETAYKQYREEEDTILKTVSKFSHFLKHNSIIAFNDFCRDYILELIDEEKKMDQQADPTLIKIYEDILQKYDQHFRDYEDAFKRTNNMSIDSSGIFAEVDKLFNLKHFGDTIKNLAEAQLTKQKTEMLIDTEIIPRNDAFASLMNSIQ